MSNVLITGCSSGIGLATALDLGRAGHTVFATMRTPHRSPQIQQSITDERLPVEIVAMDVDSDESVASAIASICSRAGLIDVLVNNAGIERKGSVEELALDDFRACMETNYFGALRCIQAVLPQMRERRRGSIINVSSIVGKIACSPLTPYVASKFALEALSEALAQEVKPFNIRVAIVQPGIIDTVMARRIAVDRTQSIYPQTHRVAGMFQASLSAPVQPSLVAELIRGIIESGRGESDSWQLRYPIGPDAQPFLGWRAAMTDEDWVRWGALDDEAWYSRVESDFGINARPRA